MQPAQANKVDPLAAHPQCLPFTSMQGPSHPDQHLINPPAARNNLMQATNQDHMLYNANQATEVQFMKQIDNMTPQFVVHDHRMGTLWALYKIAQHRYLNKPLHHTVNCRRLSTKLAENEAGNPVQKRKLKSPKPKNPDVT